MKTLDNILDNFKTELTDLIKQEEVKKEEDKKWPQEGDEYYCYCGCSLHYFNYQNGSSFDQYYFSIGQAFPTKEEAIYHHRYMKLQKELRDFADFEPDWSDDDQDKWYLRYNHVQEKWLIGFCNRYQDVNIYFRTNCLDEILNKFDLDYYFLTPSPEILEKIRGEE